MLNINASATSPSLLSTVKGSEGYSVGISRTVWTPFGSQRTEAVKNLTHEEAMQLRDDLNKHYPINYAEIITVDLEEEDTPSI